MSSQPDSCDIRRCADLRGSTLLLLGSTAAHGECLTCEDVYLISEKAALCLRHVEYGA